MNTGKQYERLQKEFTYKMRSKMHAQTFTNEVAAGAKAELNHRPEIFRLSRQLLNLKDQHYNSCNIYRHNSLMNEDRSNSRNDTLKRSLQEIIPTTFNNSTATSDSLIVEKAWKLLSAFPKYSIDEDPNFIVSMRLLKVVSYFRGDFLSCPSVATRLALQYHLSHTYRMEAPQAAAFASILPYISEEFVNSRRGNAGEHPISIVSKIGEQNTIRISPFLLKFKQSQNGNKAGGYAFENKDTVRESEGIVVGEGDEGVPSSSIVAGDQPMTPKASSPPLLGDLGNALRILAPRLKQLSPEFTPSEALGITQSLYRGGPSSRRVALSSCSVSLWSHHGDIGEMASFTQQQGKQQQNNIGKLLRDLDNALHDEIVSGGDFSFSGSSVGSQAVLSPAALLSDLEEEEGMTIGNDTLTGEGAAASSDNYHPERSSKHRHHHKHLTKSPAIQSNDERDKSLRESLLYALSRATIACEDHDDPLEIVMFLHAAARISPLIGSAHLIAIRNRLRGLMLEMNKNSIVILCRGIAKTRTCDRRLMGDLGRSALRLLGEMSCSEIADVLHAFHMTSCRHEPLLKRCAARQILLLEKQTIFTASLTIAALSHFHVKENIFYRSLGRKLYYELKRDLGHSGNTYYINRSASVSFTAAVHSLARIEVFVPELFLEPFDGFVGSCVGDKYNYDILADVTSETITSNSSVGKEKYKNLNLVSGKRELPSIITLIWASSVFGVGGDKILREVTEIEQGTSGSSDIIYKKQARHITVLFGIIKMIIKSDNSNNNNSSDARHRRMLVDAAGTYVRRPYDNVQKSIAQEVFELASVM